MKKYILAIDQGTTSTRVIIYNHQAEIVASSQKELTQYYPKQSYVEHDANEIWLHVQTVIADALFEAELKIEQIAGIGITNQRETTVVWDKRTGKPVYNALVWQSRQSQSICDDLIEKKKTDVIRTKTGLKIDPYFSASKIRWILDHVSGSQQKAEAGELLAGTIDTWLVWKLTGGKHVTDYSNASRTMLFNIHELRWDQELLELLNIPKCMMAEVKESSEIYGYTSSANFFNAKIPIAAIAGDQQAALFGQLCVQPGDVKNTYGTGCFMLMNTGDKAVRSTNGLLTTIAWSLNGKVTYALEGSVFAAGSLIQWLRDGLKIIDAAVDTQTRAKLANADSNVYVVPAFVGLGTPYWDSDVRASIFGLTRKSSDNDIIKSSLEAIAYQSIDVLNVMKRESKLELSVMKVDGGATKNDYLMQIQANLGQIKILRPKNIETTALGAAFLAGLALNYWQDIDELKTCINNQTEFKPEIAHEIANEKYETWQKAIKAAQVFK